MTTIQKTAAVRPQNTLYVVLTAFFTALVFVVTFFINIPAAFLGAGGNINLGDAVIFLAAALLGPVGGAIAGAVGAAAADAASMYFYYAPFTFVIKGIAGFVCGFLFRYSFQKRHPALRRVISTAFAALVIIIGYFFAEMLIISTGLDVSEHTAAIAALRTIPGNLIQVVLSGAIAFIALPKIFPVYFKAQRARAQSEAGTGTGTGTDSLNHPSQDNDTPE